MSVMFAFELRLVHEKEKHSVLVNEFQFATMLRILKTRNMDLHAKLSAFYEKVCNEVDR